MLTEGKMSCKNIVFEKKFIKPYFGKTLFKFYFDRLL